ncbi:unnamed protein product, partial [marine sediment metagenome]
HPKLVTASIGAAVAVLPIVIPGLPQGLSFPYPITGRAADSFFTTTNNTPMASTQMGAEGNGTLVISADESGVMTISVTAGSAANRILSILFRAQRLIGSGQLPAFSFPVTYRDNNKLPPETHEGINCMIAQQPDVDYGAADGTIPWGFVAVTLISNFSSRV